MLMQRTPRHAARAAKKRIHLVLMPEGDARLGQIVPAYDGAHERVRQRRRARRERGAGGLPPRVRLRWCDGWVVDGVARVWCGGAVA